MQKCPMAEAQVLSLSDAMRLVIRPIGTYGMCHAPPISLFVQNYHPVRQNEYVRDEISGSPY